MNDEPLDDQITVLDYSSMLYDVRKQRNELRAELNIIIRQYDALMLELQETDRQRNYWKWKAASCNRVTPRTASRRLRPA
jgi:hypothetical protein